MRLSKDIKEQIIRNAIEKAGINKEEKELKEFREELAGAVRLEAIGGEMKEAELLKIHNQIEGLLREVPEELLNSSRTVKHKTQIKIRTGGGYAYLNFANGARKISPDEYTIEDVFHPLGIAFRNYQNRYKAFGDKKRALKRSVESVLDSVTTDKKLLQVWPEAAQLLPKDSDIAISLLPAVQTKELNQLIGL